MRQLKITKQITRRDSDSLDKYLNEINKIDLISIDEEVALAKSIKSGNPVALHKLIKSNLRFVVSVSKQYQNQGLSLSDLINEGNLGLIKAAQRFDETRGFKFISYAVWWIRQSILQAIAEHARLVRLPSNKIGTINKVQKTIAELEQNFEREPSPEEIANIMEICPSEVSYYIKSTMNNVSMDAPLNNTEGMNMYDVFNNKEDDNPESEMIKDSFTQELKRCISVLSEREARIIKLYFGLENSTPYSLEEIGDKLDITRERVRQIKEKSINKLKKVMSINLI